MQGLSSLYYRGWGVPQDHVKAAQLDQIAAENGNLFAQDDMARDYATGDGVPKDMEKSQFWKAKADAQRSAAQQKKLAAEEAERERVAPLLFLATAVGRILGPYDGHMNSSAGQGRAAPADENPHTSLPQVMRFCAVKCFVLNLVNGHYDAVMEGSADGKVVSTYTVLRFTPESIVMNRTDVSGGVAVLTGRISGSSVVDGKITWQNASGPQGTFPYQLSWGVAISTAKPWGQPPQQ